MLTETLLSQENLISRILIRNFASSTNVGRTAAGNAIFTLTKAVHAIQQGYNEVEGWGTRYPEINQFEIVFQSFTPTMSVVDFIKLIEMYDLRQALVASNARRYGARTDFICVAFATYLQSTLRAVTPKA